MKLRVGVVGLGNAWDTRHAPALRALSDRFDVTAICEQVSHRAERVAAEFHAQAVDGYRALAFRSDVDAVVMLSPQWYGSLPILAACDAGKAVYCAAAIDMAPEEALRVKQRVDQSGIAFMAEFPRRQAPATLRLKELIATRLGAPKLLFCHQRLPTESEQRTMPASAPVASPKHSMIELVDWCRYVVDREPTSVIGIGHSMRPEPEAEDYEMMSLDFSQPGETGTGPIAQISCSRYFRPEWPEARNFRTTAALQVACEHGVAFVDLPATVVWFDTAGRHLETLDSERPVGEQLLAQFHRAVTSLVRRTADLEDAYRAHSVVLKARESRRLGQRLAIDDL